MPYRPFFVFPEKVRQEIPFFKYCNAFWFSVFDPPRALVPGLALTPDVTTGDPKAPSKAPEPSPVSDPGPTKTAANEDPAPSPSPAAHPQSVPQPQNTAGPSDQHPGDSTTPTPTDDAPVLPDLNAQRPAQPADPQRIPSNDGDPAAAKVSRDPYNVQSPTSTTGNSQEGDPDDSTQNDPTVQDDGSTPTTIQLGPQPNQKPTTIYVGSGSSEEASTSGIGAIIYNAFGKVSPTTSADGVSGPQASVDPAVAFPTITAAGQILTISDPSAVSIAGTVLTPGGAEATISGTPVSLAPSGNLVIGTGPPHPSSTILTIAGQIITANPTSFEIAGTPVVAGAPAVTVSGTPVGIGTAGDLVIGGTTSTPSPFAAVVTVGGQTLTANGADLVGSGTTVSAGGPAVLVAGTPVSLGPSGEFVVGDTTTTISGASQRSVFTVGDQAFTANPTKFSVAGATLSAGGPAITVSSTLISLNPSGSLVIGTSTIPLETPTPTVITTDGQTFIVEGGGLIAIGSTTLSSGGKGIIISGTPISVGPGGSLVIGISSIPPETRIPIVITTDGQTFTVNGDGLIAIGGATLTSGGAGTIISGTPISVGPSGLAIGSETVPLPTGNGSASNTLSVFTGTGARYDQPSRLVLWVSLVAMMALWVGWG